MCQADPETPVNRLLQESKDNPPVPPLRRSNSSTPTLSSREGSDKGKQPFVKSKTLETFFRRLPSGTRTAIRCASEPRRAASEFSAPKHGQILVNSASVRPESAPVREKENVPEIVPERSLVGTGNAFYEEIEIGETYFRGHGASNEEVEIGETYSKDPVTVEAVSVHDDDSDSVIVCDDLDGCGVKNSVNKDLHFKPIQTCPKTPPRAVSNTIQTLPCVVRITPRVLFSTSCFSTTHFPIVSSCVASSSKHRAGQYHADMGSLKSKLLGEENLNSSCAINEGVGSMEEGFLRQARSASPPAVKGLPHSHQSSSDSHPKSPYSRCSLEEFRCQVSHHSPIKETESDSASQVHLLSGADSVMKESSSGVKNLKELKVVHCEHERQGLGVSGPTAGNGPPVSPVRLKNSGLSVSLNEARHGSRSVSPGGTQNGDRSVSPQPSTSSMPSAASSASSVVPPPLKPLGIFNPATVPQWTDALYTETVKGKGKRLMKSVNAGLNCNRNSPKLTGKTNDKGKKRAGSSDSAAAAQSSQHVSKTMFHSKKDCVDDQAMDSVLANGVDHPKTPQKGQSSGRAGFDCIDNQSKGLVHANGVDQNKTLQKGRTSSRAGSDCIDNGSKDLVHSNGVDQHKTPQKGQTSSRAGSDNVNDQAKDFVHASGEDQHKTPRKGRSSSRASSDCVDNPSKNLVHAIGVDQQKTPQKGRSSSRAGSDCADDHAKDLINANGVDQHKTPQKGHGRSRTTSGKKAACADSKRLVAKRVPEFPSLYETHLTGTQEETSHLKKRCSPCKTDDNFDEKNCAPSSADLAQNNCNDNSIKASAGENGLSSAALDQETDTSDKRHQDTESNDKRDHETEANDKLIRRVKRQNTGKMMTAQDALKPSATKSKDGKKSSKASESFKKVCKSTSPQRSIRDWLSPKPTRNHEQPTNDIPTVAEPLPAQSKGKAASKKRTKISSSTSELSDLSSASSSVAVSPDKLSVRTSKHIKRVDPVLDTFLLTKKLQQFEASPSKGKRATATSVSPKLQKRKLADTPVKSSPAKARRLTPSETPEKDNSNCHIVGDDCFSSGEEEEEEGLTQEERDRRLALRLQRQFDLADKLNLSIVRFKGTDDQYSLRRSMSNV